MYQNCNYVEIYKTNGSLTSYFTNVDFLEKLKLSFLYIAANLSNSLLLLPEDIANKEIKVSSKYGPISHSYLFICVKL